MTPEPLLPVTPEETLPQAFRNLIVLRAAGATEEALLLELAGRGFKLPEIRRELARMEREGAVTMTPEGFYLVGRVARTESELTLTSCDPDFAQPALF